MGVRTLRKELERTLNDLRVMGGESPLRLDDDELTALACITLHDMGQPVPEYCTNCALARNGFDYYNTPIKDVSCKGCPDFSKLYETSDQEIPDFSTYFAALTTLHKRRRKYRQILETQSIPAFVTVEPRVLVEHGVTVMGVEAPTADALASWLVWRKFLYDLDNRSAQETGYLFEPLIALSIGGISCSAKKSPVRRKGNTKEGRQVDCIKDNVAYEFKLRVTIAASGQGRWGEELQFPEDCVASEYKPVLVVLDPTDNDKLAALKKVYEEHGGETYVGEDAWQLLQREAGAQLSKFLNKYVRGPIDLAKSARDHTLLPIEMRATEDAQIDADEERAVPVEVRVGGRTIPIR